MINKPLTADEVRKLTPGTDVFLVSDRTGRSMKLSVLNRSTLFNGKFRSTRKIMDYPGWHYVLPDEWR